MKTQTITNKQYYCTRAQFESRKTAGTLEVGAEYYITDEEFQPKVIVATTAPTTSTAGVVGQQYLNTTDNKMYVCTAASGTTYTWTELGGGANYTAGTGITITNNVISNDVSPLVPNQATSQNQLADKAFVNSSVQTATANFRGNWSTWTAVPTDSSQYPADYTGSKIPTVNDYMVVQDASGYIDVGTSITIVTTATGASGAIKVTIASTDYDIYWRNVLNNETLFGNILYVNFNGSTWLIRGAVDVVYNGTIYTAGTLIFSFGISETVNYSAGTVGQSLTGTWRFKYSGTWATTSKGGWQPEYQVNETPMTAAQLAAINSGITSALVGQISAAEQTSNKVTSLSSSSTDTQYPSAKCVYDSLVKRSSSITGWNQEVIAGSTTPALTLPTPDENISQEIVYIFTAASTNASFTAPANWIVCDENGAAGLSTGNTLAYTNLTVGSIYECSFKPISFSIIRLVKSETKTE